MLGFADVWIAVVFWLCIASSALCIVYGALKWNSGGEEGPSDEDRRWAEEEQKLEEEL